MGKNDKSLFVKGVEQLENNPEVEKYKQDEFPHREEISDVDRRSVLKVMGASLALAGVAGSGCRSIIMPQAKVLGNVQNPEDRVIGLAKYFATVSTMTGDVVGTMVRQYEGRPVKIEGNPNHSASMGAINARTLASIHGMYDPDRATGARHKDVPESWEMFLKAARAKIKDGGVVFLTPNVTSPSLYNALSTFLMKHPGSKWFQYEPLNDDNVFEGSKLAFGQAVGITYDFTKADVVVSLDCDVFEELKGGIRYQSDIASRRRVDEPTDKMSRLYAVESCPTTFGATADHRTPLKASGMMGVAQAIASGLGIAGASAPASAGVEAKLLGAMIADLKSARGKSVVVAGRHLPAQVHALVLAINNALGNMGATVKPIKALSWAANNGTQIAEFAEAAKAGSIKSLYILGGNPVFDAPADLGLAELIAKVPFSAHLSFYSDETSEKTLYQLGMSHELESWGDALAFDGSMSIQQPLAAPLYDTKSSLELVLALLDIPNSPMEAVQVTWRQRTGGSSENAWNEALASGKVNAPAWPSFAGTVSPSAVAGASAPSGQGYEVRFMHDAGVWDGRFANNGWLMEMPRPLTNLTWDNAVEMSVATAQKLGVTNKDKALSIVPKEGWNTMVRMEVNGQTLEMPAMVHMGVADDVLILRTGFGHTRFGSIGTKGDILREGGGFNVYPLRSSKGMWVVSNVNVTNAGKEYPLANAQFHNTLDVELIDSHREIIKHTTLEEFSHNPDVFAAGGGHGAESGGHGEAVGHGSAEPKVAEPGLTDTGQPSLYDDSTIPLVGNLDDKQRKERWDNNSQWAMTIDLNLCTGCGSCVVACQSENNIPVVGKYQVMRGREMLWMRIDRYYKGDHGKFDPSNPPIYNQPVLCMHCENAPCEPVCPVAATVHSAEGLNQMVYNRCVGTRYCSNNCPYKVRRFNFLHYTANVKDIPVLHMLQNPEVSVRTRGVMEKCTYCVQRINEKRIGHKLEGTEMKDGDVVTACQQACPSKAIVFGDMKNKESAVSKSRANKRNYLLLKELNTRPRTTYLARVHNPNPEVKA